VCDRVLFSGKARENACGCAVVVRVCFSERVCAEKVSEKGMQGERVCGVGLCK